MSDVNCPYCDKELYINHDDGYGYNEDEIYTQECEFCNKTFTYTVFISYSYTAKEAPCQNGEPHNLKTIKGIPEELFKYKARCIWCNEEVITDKAKHEKSVKKLNEFYKNAKLFDKKDFLEED